VSDLTEALAALAPNFARDEIGNLIWDVTEEESLMFDAARKWAALDTAHEVQWCRQHRDIVIDDEEGPEVCWFIMFAYRGTDVDRTNPPHHLPCKVVPALLAVLKDS